MTGFRPSPFTSVRVAKPNRWRTASRVALIGLAVLVIGGLVTALVLWRYADSKIPKAEVPALQPELDDQGEPIPDPVPGTLNILVVGTDSREGLTEEQLLELGTEDLGTKLTDTIMLVQLSPVREQAVIVSFPRDLKVDVPGEGARKINAVHALGGPNLLVEVLEDYTGIQIDHYVEVSIAGFLDLTDALGGVEVCLDAPMRDVYAGVDLPAGCQTLDGADAAGFVRSRRVEDQFGSGDDFGRIARQQYFIRQAMKEVTAAGTLLNPLKLKRLIDAVADAVVTDRDLGIPKMLELANALKDLTPDSVVMRTIPSYWSTQTGFVHAYPEQAELLFQSLRDGGSVPDVGTEGPEDLTPAQVSVEVLNGAGEEGLASEIQVFLETKGFTVPNVDNADSFDVETTTVAYVPGSEAKAELVASFLPGAELVELTDPPRAGIDVVVTVGKDRVSS